MELVQSGTISCREVFETVAEKSGIPVHTLGKEVPAVLKAVVLDQPLNLS
jgi:hypothetical protein